MGDKIKAKELVESLGVPIVPGYTGKIESKEQVEKITDDIGYPVIVKASAGGGGKGMRVVLEKEELWDSVVSAQNEARLAFGNDEVFIRNTSKATPYRSTSFGDGKGKMVHLFQEIVLCRDVTKRLLRKLLQKISH